MSLAIDPSSTEKPVVLIVDDQSIIINSVTALLTKLGYTMVSARNGQEGLEQAQAYKPDIIVTDLQMPGMDGYDMIRQLRIMREFFFTPIIIMTSLGQSEDRKKGFQLGADDFINKDHMYAEIGFRLFKALSAARLQKRCATLEMKLMNMADVSFSGHLTEFRLFSLITICRMEHLSSLLELTNESGEKGLVYLLEGEIVSAKIIGNGRLKNEEAIGRMLKWSTGTFTLDKMDTSNIPREIKMSTESLLMIAASRTDEEHVSAHDEALQATARQ